MTLASRRAACVAVIVYTSLRYLGFIDRRRDPIGPIETCVMLAIFVMGVIGLWFCYLDRKISTDENQRSPHAADDANHLAP